MHLAIAVTVTAVAKLATDEYLARYVVPDHVQYAQSDIKALEDNKAAMLYLYSKSARSNDATTKTAEFDRDIASARMHLDHLHAWIGMSPFQRLFTFAPRKH